MSDAAAYYTNIVIDGTFDDWAGVPVATTDVSGDDGGGPDLASLQVANDESNLYLRVAYHASINPNAGPSVYLGLDNDVSTATGFDVFGLGAVGSDVGWQNDFPFAQAAGIFNNGTVSGGGAAIAPYNTATTNQEYAIPLSAVIDAGPSPVFVGTTNRLLVYTDFTPASETMGPVTFALSPRVEQAVFQSFVRTNVFAFLVPNSNPTVSYSLESAPTLVPTNWTATGYAADGNGGDLYMYDPVGFATTKVYRVIATY